MYEFERAQRAEMGVPEFTDDVTAGSAVEEGGDLPDFGEVVPGMDEGLQHRAAQDEDEESYDTAGRLHMVC